MGQSSAKPCVVAWGSWEHGQLGVGQQHYQTSGEKFLTPRPLESLPVVNVPRRSGTLVTASSSATASGGPPTGSVSSSGGSAVVRQVSCGGHHSAAVAEGGVLLTWGRGDDFQLGHPSCRDVHVPKIVKSIQGKSVIQVSCGDNHTACVTSCGMVLTWGLGQNGRLGHGTEEPALAPRVVQQLVMEGVLVGEVSCGSYHTACLAAVPQSTAYSWGLGLNGRLGHGDEVDSYLPKIIQFVVNDISDAPHEDSADIRQPNESNITSPPDTKKGETVCAESGTSGIDEVQRRHAKISEGASDADTASRAQKRSGRAAGDEVHEGHARVETSGLLPGEEVKNSPRLSRIVCGGHHTAAITHDGALYTWGGGAFGKLGHGSRLNVMSPKLVKYFIDRGKICTDVSLGAQTSICATEQGEVYTWGQRGQLGHSGIPGAESDGLLPRQVTGLAGHVVLQVACGTTHQCAVKANGEVWAWGTSRHLAHGDPSKPSNQPSCVLSSGGKPVTVSCAVSHTLVLVDSMKDESHSATGLAHSATAHYPPDHVSHQQMKGPPGGGSPASRGGVGPASAGFPSGSAAPRDMHMSSAGNEVVGKSTAVAQSAAANTTPLSNASAPSSRSQSSWRRWPAVTLPSVSIIGGGSTHPTAGGGTKSPQATSGQGTAASAVSAARQHVASALGLSRHSPGGVYPPDEMPRVISSDTPVETAVVGKPVLEPVLGGPLTREVLTDTPGRTSGGQENVALDITCGVCGDRHSSLPGIVASLSKELRAYQEENSRLRASLDDATAVIEQLLSSPATTTDRQPAGTVHDIAERLDMIAKRSSSSARAKNADLLPPPLHSHP